MNYRLLYDLGKPTVLIGYSVYHQNLLRDLSKMVPTEMYSLDQICNHDDQWLQDRQFFYASSNMAWKKNIASVLNHKSIDWISIINANSEIDESCTVGRGVWINNHNILMDTCSIGDHSVITNQCLLGHYVSVGDFCHIGPRCFLSWCDIGLYNCLASNCTILGRDQSNKISTVDRCNFKLNSCINKSITKAGTYQNKTLVDKRDSLEHKLF